MYTFLVQPFFKVTEDDQKRLMGQNSFFFQNKDINFSPKMTFQHFSNFCRKKFPGLIKGISCPYWMNVEVLPHDFCKLQPLKLYKIVQEPFCQAWKLFSAEIWKMLECHFWSDVMFRASRASLAQKSQGLRVVCSKNFSRATFFVFWSTPMVDIYIWAICLWNKFDEKAQCEKVSLLALMTLIRKNSSKDGVGRKARHVIQVIGPCLHSQPTTTISQ